MTPPRQKTVLFLCTGNYYRSRFAELLFSSVARTMSLPWTATSRGLALERGTNNIGPMAVSAVQALEARGVRGIPELARFPIQAAQADFEAASWIVALKEAEHLPLLTERFPAWTDKVEYWQVDDAPEVLGLIEREVMDLAARLIRGGKRRTPPDVEAEIEPPPAKSRAEKPPSTVVRLGRATKGRRGKGVTTVTGLALDEPALLELAATLKTRCGTGGTVRDGIIEIQGDQRERLAAVLEAMGYHVKKG